MSLLHSVVDAVQRGATTTQELADLFPGVGWTRIKRAEQNAAYNGYIRNTGTNRAAVWQFVRSPAPQGCLPARPSQRPVSSVFQMGERIALGMPCWTPRRPMRDFERAEA